MFRSCRIAAVATAASLLLSACADSTGNPTADAGQGGTIPKRTAVMLDGTGSRPGRGDQAPLAFAWRQTAGTPVELSDLASITPVFVSPGVSGMLTFELVVRGRRESLPASVSYLVANQPPLPSAGPDLSVRQDWLASVSALGSHDPDGDPLTFTWLQTAGPPIELEVPVAGIARFTASVQGTLAFALVVSDGEATATDEVSVRVYPPGANLPPTAEAGTDQNARSGDWVTLWGTGSDPDGFSVALSWAQKSGPPVVLSESGTASASFIAPPGDADLEFELTVSDGVSVGTDTMTVHVGVPGPEITSLAIVPVHPRTSDDLTAVVQAQTPGSAIPPVLAFAWSRNGTVVPGREGDTFPASLTTKGDHIAVRVTASAGGHQSTRDASVTIQDSPPVPTFAVPGNIPFGAPFTAQVTLTDPDGDPVPTGALALVYGPAGMALAANGALSWTPTLPMFERTLEVHYGVSVAGGAPYPGTLRVTDPTRELAMRRAGFEIPANAEAVRARDLDGDGADELVVAGLSGVHVLEHVGAGYAITWMAPFREPNHEVSAWGSAAAVEALDVDGDGAAEIFYGERTDLVRVDGLTRVETGRASFGEQERFIACEAADLDRDGRPDLACLLSSDTYSGEGLNRRVVVLDPGTMEMEWSSALLPLGASLAIGDVDGDAALEVVTSAGFVFDGATHANEWTYGPGFGSFVQIGRLVSGGPPVIVGGSPLRGYSATLKSPLWEYPNAGAPFLLRDVDGDGADEVIALSTSMNRLQALDYVGGSAVLSPAWTASAGDLVFGTRALAVGDLDGDGEAEVVWDDGASSTGEDSLVVGGPLSSNLAIEWQNRNPSQLDGPMLGGFLARTGPGQTRLVFQSVHTDSGYAGARLVLLDPDTGLLSTSPELGSNWAGGGGIAVADYDGDGVDEVFVATASYYDGYFAAWDPATGLVAWSAPPTSSSDAPTAVRAADMNGDGHPDLVGLMGTGVIWIWDVRNETLIWKSTTLGQAAALEVVDLDGTGRPEVVVGAQGRLVVFRWSDTAGLFLEAASAAFAHVTDIAAGDCDGDGTPELYVLGSEYYGDAKTITVLDASLVERVEYQLPQTATSVHVEDLGPGRKNLAVSLSLGSTYGYGNEPYVFAAIDPSTGTEIWRSPLLFGPVSRDSASWLELGGRSHLVLGTGRSMLMTR